LSCPPFELLRINSGGQLTLLVIPAKAGIQFSFVVMVSCHSEPACPEFTEGNHGFPFPDQVGNVGRGGFSLPWAPEGAPTLIIIP